VPQDHIDASYFSPDILEFLQLLQRHQVRYLVVGGEAVIYHGHIRLTGDIDFFYDCGRQNAEALFEALLAFWDRNIPGIKHVEELQEEGVVVQFGRPPNRIDLLNRIDGVDFEEAWQNRITVTVDAPASKLPVYYIGLDDLIRNKEASGRAKGRISIFEQRKRDG
jgi:hypothetical protein